MFDGLSSLLRGQSIEIDLRTVMSALPCEARDDPVGSKICPASANPFRSTGKIPVEKCLRARKPLGLSENNVAGSIA
jgi:hypothetical protein